MGLVHFIDIETLSERNSLADVRTICTTDLRLEMDCFDKMRSPLLLVYSSSLEPCV